MEKVRKLTEQIIREASDQFCEAWNNGDIDTACEIYDENALYVTPKGLVRGKEAIAQSYRDVYPNQQTMGTLSLELLDFWTEASPKTVAVAIFRWQIDKEGLVTTGYVMEVYTIVLGRAVIVHDASM